MFRHYILYMYEKCSRYRIFFYYSFLSFICVLVCTIAYSIYGMLFLFIYEGQTLYPIPIALRKFFHKKKSHHHLANFVDAQNPKFRNSMMSCTSTVMN